MVTRQCPRCFQFRGRGVHRCPAVGAVGPSAGVGGVGSGGLGPVGLGSGRDAGVAGYGAVYEAFRAQVPTGAGPAVDGPGAGGVAPAARVRDHLRFGRRFEYHGRVAVSLEAAGRALAARGSDGAAFDARAVENAVQDVAARVHRWVPEPGTEPVYGATSRAWATRVVNMAVRGPDGSLRPDFVVRDDSGKARFVRPEVASLLTSVRDDLRGHAGLREAARVEAQRAVARAALADALH